MNALKCIWKLSACLTVGALLAVFPGCSNQNGDGNGTQEAKNPVVTMQVKDFGTIQLELYPKIAPNTVNNFISLINQGFYDGLTFHRVVKGFMIQGGDPEGNGMGGPGYSIKGEFTNNGFENTLSHERGVISMARRSMPMDSAGSQFFIMQEAAPHLDGDYAAFGKVTEGMDVVDKIAEVAVSGDRPQEPPVIEKMTVETFGATYPEPEIIQ